MADEKQKSACLRRHEQLKRWDDSDTSKQPTVLKRTDRKVKFQDGCVFLAACSSGDIEEVSLLLKRGADINTANVDGLTALHQACIDDNLDMVEYLIENGADIDVCDNEGWTALHATASCGFCEVARFLLEYGANVAAVNNDGDLAIDLGTENDMEELLAEYMEKQQIDADSARNEEENRMLADANQWLNSHGVQEQPHPKTGATALHVAAAKGYLKVMQILLMANVDIDAKDTDGWTPLHAAAHWGQEEACKLLVENMCNMEARNYSGQTCFDVADDDLLKLLEELKIKQASLREDSKKERPHLDIIETKHPMKRRTSITRMSLDQKQHIILGDVQEERQKMEALMHKHDIPHIDEDAKEEDKKSSPSSSSDESSSDSETVSDKQIELNKDLTAKPEPQEQVKENETKPEEQTVEPATLAPAPAVLPVATTKVEEETELSKTPTEVVTLPVNGEVDVFESETTATVTLKDTSVKESLPEKAESKTEQKPDEKTDPTADVSGVSDVSVSISLNNVPSASAIETAPTTKPEVVENKAQPATKVSEPAKAPEKTEEPTETMSASEVRRRRRRQLREEAEMLDKKFEEETKHKTDKVSSKEESKQKEHDKEVADEAPSYSPRPISSKIESGPGPSSWRAGLRKTGSSSAVPDTVPLRRIGEERVQRSASSPRLAPDVKTDDTQDRSYRRPYLSSTSSIQENPPDVTTTRNRNTYPYSTTRPQTAPAASATATAAASSIQSDYVPYSRRRAEREAEREKERASLAATGMTTLGYRRSYEPPKRDEETETQRKMRARRARETRRSTQGVTKEDVAAAEATLQMAGSDKNGKALSSQSTESKTETKPEDSSSTYVRRRRDYNTTNEDDSSNLSSSSFRRSRDHGETASTTASDTTAPSASGYLSRSQRLSAIVADANANNASMPMRSSSYRRRHGASDEVEEDKPAETKTEEKKKEEKKEEDFSGRLSGIRARRRRIERRPTGKVYGADDTADAKEEEDTEDKKTTTTTKTEPEETQSSSRYSDRYGAGDRSSYSDRYSSTRSRDTDRPSSYRYSRASTTAASSEPDTTQDFKKLYEEQKTENERIKKELAQIQKENSDGKAELEKIKATHSRLGNSMDQREKRALERKVSEMEEELKQMEILKQDNQRLKEENGALIRVISKLSK